MKLLLSAVAALMVVSSVPVALAQNSSDTMAEMRQNVELLSTTLEEGLGLNERRGVFSPRAGDVHGRYLQGQGVVLEVQTPLQTREGFTMDAFSTTLSQLSSQLDGLLQQGALSRPDFETMRDQLAMTMRSDEAAAYYRELIQQLQRVQDIPAIERALANAASTLQSLQALGQIDPATRDRLSQQIQSQREQLQQHMAQWDALRQQIREQLVQADAIPGPEVQQAWAETRVRLETELSALKASISEQADQLQQQHERAEQVRQQQAADALEDFQSRLFMLLCDYAAGLRAMPSGESLNVVLTGVGEPLEAGGRRDIIYLIPRDDLQACLQGQITAQQLRGQAFSYQY